MDKKYQFWIKVQEEEQKPIFCHANSSPESHQSIIAKLEQALATMKALHPHKGIHQCPLCNASMIRRAGKYGDFYVCTAWKSNKCKGTRNLNGSPPARILELAEQKPPKKEEPRSGDILDNIEIE